MSYTCFRVGCDKPILPQYDTEIGPCCSQSCQIRLQNAAHRIMAHDEIAGICYPELTERSDQYAPWESAGLVEIECYSFGVEVGHV